MNEPYQKVHRNEDSNSTLGSIAKYTGINLAISGATELGIVAGAKYVNEQKHPNAHSFLNAGAYNKGEGGRVMSALTSGVATKKGRIVNYGMSAVGGILAGALASRE